MAELTLDGTEIPVAPDGHDLSIEPRTPPRRSGGGQLRSATTDARPKTRTWRFRTPWVTWAEGLSYEAILNAAGQVTADGDMIGLSLAAYVSDVEREADSWLGYMRLSFRLIAAEFVERLYLTQRHGDFWGLTTDPRQQDGSFRTSNGVIGIGAVSASERLWKVGDQVTISNAPTT